MRGWIIFLSLCAFVGIAHYTSKLLHNISPSLRVVERKLSMDNLEARRLGYPVREGRDYYRKIIYEERRQTKGLRIVVQRDTTSNEVYYKEDE